MKLTMTEDTAYKLFLEWRNRLKLFDWEIRFNWAAPACEMGEGNFGETHFLYSSGLAEIKMLSAIDYERGDYGEFPFDYEKTLVHELLHVKFAALDDTGDDLRDKLTHKMIDDMARALVDAKRAGRDKGAEP